MRLQMAQSSRRKTAQFQLGHIQCGFGGVGSSLTPNHREAARACGLCIVTHSSRKQVRPRNRMRENRTSGSVRAPGNGRSYRERRRRKFLCSNPKKSNPYFCCSIMFLTHYFCTSYCVVHLLYTETVLEGLVNS